MNTLSPRTVRTMFVAASLMMILSLALSVFNVATVLSAPLQSAVSVPNLVGFEGFIADAGGNPVTDGSYAMTFAVYNVASGGAALWSETHASAEVTDGLYAVTLGSVTAFPAGLFDGNRWIGVTVGNGTEMSPRTRVSSVPFALNADSANKLAGTSGLIALFETSCPTGWSEVTSTQGRVVLGRPAGGTAGATVGTALSNQGTRTITDVPAHTHGVGSYATNSSGTHTHNVAQYGFGSWNDPTRSTGGQVGHNNPPERYNAGTDSAGSHTHTVSGTSGSTGSASVDVTMPYVQLVYCKLNS